MLMGTGMETLAETAVSATVPGKFPNMRILVFLEF